MNSDLIFVPIVLGYGVLFLLFLYFIGSAFSLKIFSTALDINIQKLVLGYCLFIIILRTPFRNNLPIEPFFVAIILLSSVGLIKFYKNIRSIFQVKSTNNLFLIKLILISGIIPLFILALPYLMYGATYFENIGPDLDGHLISASMFLEGRLFGDHLHYFYKATESSHWWSNISAWTLPDFREAVAVEFTLRTLRYAHSLIVSFIALISGKGIWFGMLVGMLCAFTLTYSIIGEFIYRLGLKPIEKIFLYLLVATTPTIIIESYEGIIGQIFGAPLFTFALLNTSRLSKIDCNSSFYGNIFPLLILSALLTTFGEGLQILLVYFLIFFLVEIIKNKLKFQIEIPKNIAIFFGIFLLFNQPFSYDFFAWTYFRILQGFNGGIFHINWDVFSLIYALPIFYLNQLGEWKLLYEGNIFTNYMEIILLALGSLYLYWHFKKNSALFLLVYFLTILVFLFSGNKYALWKCIVILQPMILIHTYCISGEKIGCIKKVNFLIICVAIIFASSAILLTQYSNYSKKIYSNNYGDQSLKSLSKKVFLFPSKSNYYTKLGATSDLIMVNEPDWALRKPNFSSGAYDNYPVVLYYSCVAEGAVRCEKIREKGLLENKLYVTSLTLRDILSLSDSQRVLKIRSLITQYYGVEEGGVKP